MRRWSRTTMTGRMRTLWSVTWPVSWWPVSRTRSETRSVLHSPPPKHTHTHWNTHTHTPTPFHTHTLTPLVVTWSVSWSLASSERSETRLVIQPSGHSWGGGVGWFKIPCWKVFRGYKLLYGSRLLLRILMFLKSCKLFHCFLEVSNYLHLLKVANCFNFLGELKIYWF